MVSRRSTTFYARRLHLAALAPLGFMLAAAGCQSSDVMSTDSTPAPPTEKISEAELRAYCPKVALRDGTVYFSTYQKGGDGDANKLVYQASLADVTRSCTYGEGTMTMNIAVAGKVVPGPVGGAGTVTMPIRIAVTRGEEVLYSQLHQYQVSVPDASGSVQFVFNDPNVTVPQPTSHNYRVFAGYDEGVAKKVVAATE